MSPASTTSARLSSTVPAFAAVLVSAMFLSVALATGTAPRLAPGMAMQAMLLGTAGGQSQESGASVESGPMRSPVAGEWSSRLRAPLGDHDAFLLVAASIPGHGSLPPPNVG